MAQDWEYGNVQGAYARRQGDYVFLGNASLERVIRLSGEVMRTVELVNKVSGRTPASLETTEFMLELSGALQGEFAAQDFRFQDVQVIEPKPDTLRATFSLVAKRTSHLRVKVVFEVYAKQKYQRKWLTVHWDGKDDTVVERIDVEVPTFGWWNVGNPTHYGFGQPILVGDLYMGLEYPAAESTPTSLRHFPGRSARRGLQSKSAIWGVALSSKQTRVAFLQDYLASLLPRAPKPFVIYNLMGVGNPLGIPTEHDLLNWIERIGQATKQAGMCVDTFAVDDRWQDESTIWQPAPRRFPQGFGKLAEAARRQNSHLGLWASLSGFTLDTRWGAQEGLEVTQLGDRSSQGRYCLAGPNYAARLKEVLTNYCTRDGVNYFKLDYNEFGCDNPLHGHPIGRAGKEAQVDAFLDILQHLRGVNPEIFLAVTSGMWLSPWWLPYADAVWLGGNDTGTVEEVPGLTPHDSAITYRDVVLYEDYRIKQYVFPQAFLMTHGFWVAGDAPFSRFKDDIILTLGRGVSKWELLTAPQSLDAKRYAFLSQALRWGKSNWEILAHTEMILGNPGKGEVYGFAHVGKGAALLFLRNPSLESRLLELSPADMGLSQELLSRAKDTPRALEVYPAYSELDWNPTPKGNLSLEVLGCQCKCIAIVWERVWLDRVKL